MSDLLLHSRTIVPAESGVVLEVTPELARWEFIRFGVRQLAAGAVWQDQTRDQEACLVLLSGRFRIRWDRNGREHSVGPRASVFSGYPHAVYLPAGTDFRLEADELTEIADCRAPSAKALAPRVVRPEDCGFEIRGGGNATRQIVDILPPAFPADRLLICEVFTPSGNWSSYPPHKHDRDNPPDEVDLEETYYFRFRDPGGYGFQRIYTTDGRVDETLKVESGDLALIRDGYHPFVTAFGYDAYYLNVLAGTRRSMAAADDPRYAAFRKNWPTADPRMPVVAPPRPRANPVDEAGRAPDRAAGR
jgi:5-deoxy-glucuronate isomerase